MLLAWTSSFERLRRLHCRTFIVNRERRVDLEWLGDLVVDGTSSSRVDGCIYSSARMTPCATLWLGDTGQTRGCHRRRRHDVTGVRELSREP